MKTFIISAFRLVFLVLGVAGIIWGAYGIAVLGDVALGSRFVTVFCVSWAVLFLAVGHYLPATPHRAPTLFSKVFVAICLFLLVIGIINEYQRNRIQCKLVGGHLVYMSGFNPCEDNRHRRLQPWKILGEKGWFAPVNPNPTP